MSHFEPVDPDFEQRVRSSFSRQKAMVLIGARLTGVAAGRIEIRLPYKAELTQQHGYIHGGIVGTIGDSAGGYAAYTLMPSDSSVLTIEYKMNLLAPADGEELIARGDVLRAGRTLVVARADVFAVKAGREHLCASLLQTLMTLHGTPDDDRRRS